ncbi:exopolysaccharide biosynthesis protein [Primorskyibacter sp. 2E107]|uniref:CpsD/CapB family tyrosine-protein kinase n=1 Tax=Primorskyibacter sp. 2E107 TaxID=3403458 RepID=UPI003AF5BBB9
MNMMDRRKFKRKFRKTEPETNADDGATIEPLENRTQRVARQDRDAAELDRQTKAAAEAERAAIALAEQEKAEEERARQLELQRRKAEAKRLAAAKAAREAAEQDAARRAEQERRRAEAKRLAEERAARQAAEAERQRRADEKRRHEAEAARKAREEADRLEAEAIETARREARLAEEQARKDAELARQKEAFEAKRRAREAALRRKAEDDAKIAERQTAERAARRMALREEAEKREADARAVLTAPATLPKEPASTAGNDDAVPPILTKPITPGRPNPAPEPPIDVQPQPEAAPAPARDAAATWQSLREFDVSESHLAAQRVITATREDPAYTTFDVLRTRLLQALGEHGWKRVAITSPTKDCGKTFTAANLAISLSRQENCRTLLLDCDMRRPTLQKVLGRKNPGSMGDMLRGKLKPQEHLVRIGQNRINAGRNIAFGFNEVVEPYASELLQDPRTAATLDRIEEELAPDVVLFDLPPALYYDDVIAFRPLFDGVLLVVGGGITTEKEIKEVERRLGEETPLLGMVLNKAENTEVGKYQY